MNEPNQTDRRGWLRSCARWTALAGIAGVGGYLVGRPPGADGRPCRLQLPCRRCGVFSRCGLSKAVAARRQLQR